MHLRLNGRDVDVPATPDQTLLAVLRERLQLTGTRLACDRGECGACTVLVDGAPAYACLTLAAGCEGSAVTTIEGLAAPGTAPGAGPALHPLQAAFIRHDAVQCGYCTPGQIMAAVALLTEHPDPTDTEIAAAMSGNLCRCGTYPKIVAAVRDAAAQLRGDAAGGAAGDPADGGAAHG